MFRYGGYMDNKLHVGLAYSGIRSTTNSLSDICLLE